MKRNKKPAAQTAEVIKKSKVLYQKVGGGQFRVKSTKQWVKTGDTFEAYPNEIPKAFKDLLVEVKPEVVAAKKAAAVAEPIAGYEKVARKAKGWFNVVDSNGKTINETALREKDADELLASKLETLPKEEEEEED